jgi:cobalt-zinc-cadmium efflux system protein
LTHPHRHGHDPAAEHDHDHGHHDPGHHDHYRELGRRRLIIVLAMTSVFMVVEFVGGWLANSLALMADAGHMLNDVAALALTTWFALWISRRPATPPAPTATSAWRSSPRSSTALPSSFIAGVIFWHAWHRFRQPPEVEGTLMLAVATGGLLVNIIAAFLLHSSSAHNLNMRGAYLHVLGDLLGSVGAITAAVIILLTGWYMADPLISVFVASLILVGAWRLVRESVDILLEAVPRHIDMAALHRAILDIDGVDEVHDLHVWTLTSGFLAMSGHTVIRDPARHQDVLGAIHRAHARPLRHQPRHRPGGSPGRLPPASSPDGGGEPWLSARPPWSTSPTSCGTPSERRRAGRRSTCGPSTRRAPSP